MKRGLFTLTVAILLLCAAGISSVSAEKCKIKVTSEPQGAMFAVNLAVLKFGPTPMNFEFERGKTYTLTFTKDGYKSKAIDYKADCKDISVQLEKEGGSGISVIDATGKCTLQVTSNVVSASVYIDEQLKGKIPFTTVINYGSHTIRVKMTGSGYGDYFETIQVNQPTMKVEAILSKGGNTVSSGTLRVNANVAGANVYINDALKGKIPYTAKLDYGSYHIRVSSEGYGDYEETVNVNRSEVTVTANLSKIVRSATVQIISNVKGAKIYIDDDYKGQAPLTVKLEYGAYQVRVSQDGYDDFEETYDIDTQTFKISANLERWKSTRLQIISNVKNADVYIDGDLVGQVPLNTNVDFGSHDIQVSADGYEDYWETIDAKTRDLKITANLERAVKINLTVYSNIAGADVFINNAKVGKTPLVRQQSSGVYKLKVTLPGSGYNDFSTTFRLKQEDAVVEALLTADNQLNVDLPLQSKVRVDNIWYDINWEQAESKKQSTQVITIYAPDRKHSQMHDLYIEYNGLEFSKSVRFYNAKEKAPVLKLRLALE